MTPPKTAPDLFASAAERAALANGKPLSQVRAEIEFPTPEALPADSLFAPAPPATIEKTAPPPRPIK